MKPALGNSGSNFSLAMDRVLPDYGGRCIASAIPAILAGIPNSSIDDAIADASTVVLLVIDGLGWHQLRRYGMHAPVLHAAATASSPVTTVLPSTTATALTSLTTGAAPGEHGLMGYRIPTPSGLLNTLRWRAGGRDARIDEPAHEIQPVVPFCGEPTSVISRSEFEHSGFTTAHLRGATFVGWNDIAGLVAGVLSAAASRQRLIFAYYDTLDKVAHEHGLGEEYFGVLATVDRLVATLRDVLAEDVALVVTADHGMLEVPELAIIVDRDVVEATQHWSGEARLLWLHARPRRAAELQAACDRYSAVAEVATIEQVLDERWFGTHVCEAALDRLGDVVLAPRGVEAFTMPDEARPQHPLIGRHGGLTAEEMLVPFVRV